MHIRFADRSDLPEIVAIYNAAVPGRMATADLSPISVESRLQWFEDHPPDRYPIWVMADEDRVAGWLSLQMFYGRLAYRETAEVSIYVAPEYQGQGVGRSLLCHAITSCPQLEIRTLLGFVFGHNTPSLKLLTSLGFEHWGKLPEIANLDGNERDLVLLGRKVYSRLKSPPD